MDTLEQIAPCNQKYTRGDHLPFMNKTIAKEITERTKLRNKFLKNRMDMYVHKAKELLCLLIKKNKNAVLL